MNTDIKIKEDFSIKYLFINACMNGIYKDVEYILKNNKIDANLGIIYACISGNLDIIKILLKFGADPNYIDNKYKKWTPILATLIGNNWNDKENKDDIINELIKYGGIVQYWFFDYINYYKTQIDIIKNSNYTDYYRLKYIF